MSYLEIFEMNSNGAGWINVDDLPMGDVMAIEIELATQKPAVQMLCWNCLAPIPSGTGNACNKHKR
jgi:hypothetical protein